MKKKLSINKTKTNELKKQIGSLKQDAKYLKKYIQSLLQTIKYNEDRIAEMENSKFWKVRNIYFKIKYVLFSTRYVREEDMKFFRKIRFLMSSSGKKIIRKFFLKIFKNLYLLLEEKPVTIVIGNVLSETTEKDPYKLWLNNNAPREIDFKEFKGNISYFKFQPAISIILPVFDPDVELFQKTLLSVIDQIYPNWELCIADDKSVNPEIRKTIEKFALKDRRIKFTFRAKNGNISECSNSAMELASGEFIAFLDHDDLLTRDALYHVVKEINKDKNVDLIYSDEDKIDSSSNLSEPHFKPDWCPDSFLSRNYINHFVVLRKKIVDKIGHFRIGFEGSQDYDLLLRFTEKSQKIKHIARILYHWRKHRDSVSERFDAKPKAFIAAEKAIKDALERRKEKANVKLIQGLPGIYNIRYKIKNKKKVSIIIPSKNKSDILNKCISSIITKSTYDNYEIIVINNNSTEKKFFDLTKKYKKQQNGKFNCYDNNDAFNFSKLMNFGVSKASGDYILLLNNDTEVITKDWIEAMVEQVQRDSIGAVGAKLLFPNDTIQHAGVVIGLGDVAGHTFIGKHKDDNGYFNYIKSINNYSALTAACLMVKKSVYYDVGGFDEDLQVEFNDTDFCLKLLDKGYYNVYLPHINLYHYESLSRGHPKATIESEKRHNTEIAIFKAKWQKYIDFDPCYSPNLSKDVTDFQLNV
ncbi:MAG: glycosyltransferase family 2 protein [Bacteroidota bacterium]|nr:glycosyltransferase family 2 protein [Bacteroidota bacterium]